MTGTKQGGSILNFIVVAVVLVGLLAAGIYVVRQVTQQSSPEGGVVSTQEEDSERSEESQPPQEVEIEGQVHELPGVTEDSTEELPRTGPIETLGGALALGMLSLVTVYYLRSRRPELSL